MGVPLQLVLLARRAAAAQSLDPALVCAVVEQESAWNPWAMRYEPLFFAKYVASLSEKRTITTPAQIVRELQQQIPLPAPLALAPTSPADACSSGPVCGPEGLDPTR